jgi:hypothetical protein
MKLTELQSPAEVNQMEQYLDKMFMTLGLDVEFVPHFVERILGRERKVTVDEVVSAFGKLKNKYKRKLLTAKKKPNYQAILKDFEQDLNIVFKIQGAELTGITIKRKDPAAFHVNARGGEELKV